MSKSGVGGGSSGAREYFSTGSGMPYPAHPYRSPDKTNEQRNRKIPIDLDNLEQPGVGPVNFEVKRGRMQSPLTTRTVGKDQGDID